MFSIKAKFPGKCPKCGNRYIVGVTEITKENERWVHVNCTEAEQQKNFVGKSYETIGRNVPQPIAIDTDAVSDFERMVENETRVEESLPKVEKKAFKPSKYQQAIYDALTAMVKGEYSHQHLVIEAVAGSGKTTTIVNALELIPDTYEVAFIAFNRHIAHELKNRAPSYVHVSTLHSLGLTVIRNNIKKVRIDANGDKLGDRLNEMYPVSKRLVNEGVITAKERIMNYAKRTSLRSVISICKATLIDYEDQNAVLQTIERYGIEVDEVYLDEILQKLPEVMQYCKDRTELVDFDDMVWLPLVNEYSFEKFDFLMVDEAQDMNASQIEFIMKSVKSDGHVIAVGDRNQSLYGFRGADTEAIPNIINRLNANTLPLSVTYRCPSKHVELARRIVPQLEARENAPEGEVSDLNYFDLASRVQPGDMVICRTNAPLIKPAFECIRMGKKAIIRGKDIGASLVNLIKRFETDDISAFSVNLAEYYEKERSRLLDKGKEMQVALLDDRVDTLTFIMNECQTVSELLAKIDMLFSDTNIGVVFSSVHRAKGLEADNVFILKPELMPHPKAEQDWEKEQEMNALYVAQTRSKDKLYLVKGGDLE